MGVSMLLIIQIFLFIGMTFAACYFVHWFLTHDLPSYYKNANKRVNKHDK